MLRSVAVKDIRPNPFRRLEEYPILREKVDALKESIATTGFWDNLLGRPAGDHVEIAYGHHRLVALREVLGPDHEVRFSVRELTNEQMIKIMASENSEVWSTSAWVEIETVRSTIDAFADGLIELPKPDARGGNIRTLSATTLTKTYTMRTVAEFLGWTVKAHKNGRQPNKRCEVAFKAIDAMERGLITPEDIKGLKRSQVDDLIDVQATLRRREEALAEVQRQEAEAARARAKQADDGRTRRLLEIRADRFDEQARVHADAAVNKPREFARTAAAKYKADEKQSIRKTRQEALETTTPVRPVLRIDEVAEKMAAGVDSLLKPGEDLKLADQLQYIAQHMDDLSEAGRSNLYQSLTSLITRAEWLRKPFAARV